MKNIAGKIKGKKDKSVRVSDYVRSQMRRELAEKVCKIIRKQKGTQREIAEACGIGQSRLCLLLRNSSDFDKYSVEYLALIAESLGRKVKISIK